MEPFLGLNCLNFAFHTTRDGRVTSNACYTCSDSNQGQDQGEKSSAELGISAGLCVLTTTSGVPQKVFQLELLVYAPSLLQRKCLAGL